MHFARYSGAVIAVSLWFLLTPFTSGQTEDQLVISTQEEIQADVEQAPCNDKDRQAAVQASGAEGLGFIKRSV